MYEKPARLESVDLEIEDHGILTFSMPVQYDQGGYQDIGGYALDDAPEKRAAGYDRRPALACGKLVLALCRMFGKPLSKIRNEPVMVLTDSDGWNAKPLGIRPLFNAKLKDKPLIFSELFGR